LVKEVKGSEDKQKWHSHSIHASDEDDIENSWVFEMNNILLSAVKIFILGHWSFFSIVDISSEFIVKSSLHPWNHEASSKSNVWQDRVNEHSIHNFMTYICVPKWHVIVIIFVNILCDEFWFMLSHIGINEQENDTGVQELSVENSICNAW